MKILLAEDEEQLSRVLQTAMLHEGYEVDVAFDGQKAVLAEIFGSNLFLHNKTITQTPTSASSKNHF